MKAKHLILITSILMSLFLTTHAQETDKEPSLISLVAGHLRNGSLPREGNQVLYTIVVKSNQMTLKVWENIYQGNLKKRYPLISAKEVDTFNPYVVPECFQEGYRYLLAGDIFKGNSYYFEGIVVGVPRSKLEPLYLCSIKKNNGLQTQNPRRDLGPFELAYRKVDGLEIGRISIENLRNLLWLNK